MISDDELLLYHYRELDAAGQARVGKALAERPELAQRLHRLVARLDAAAATPEVEVPEAIQQRWLRALESAAARPQTAVAPGVASRRPWWLAAAASLLLVTVALLSLRPERMSPPPAEVANVASPASAYERGLRQHLASAEQQLVSLASTTPEERAQLLRAIVEQNRLYALAAERAGEPQLARVLRAFTPLLEDVANGRAQSDAGSLAQLAFELRVLQARLRPPPVPSHTL